MSNYFSISVCLYAGDSNCPYIDLGYNFNSANGDFMASWAEINKLILHCNPKNPASFYLGRWNTGTKPDLTFVSVGSDNHIPNTLILEKFPRSLDKPSIIVPPKVALLITSRTVKRCNFCKGHLEPPHCNAQQACKEFVASYLSDVDQALRNLCNAIRMAAKKFMPRGHQRDHVLCWDAKFKGFYQTFLQSPEGSKSSRDATKLLRSLDKKQRDRWSKAV